jgi:hypothetical protein
MKTLNELGLTEANLLSRDQMVKVKGGDWAFYHCTCGYGQPFTVFTDGDPSDITLCGQSVAVCNPTIA